MLSFHRTMMLTPELCIDASALLFSNIPVKADTLITRSPDHSGLRSRSRQFPSLFHYINTFVIRSLSTPNTRILD